MWWGVCVYVCPAMRFVMLRDNGAGTWHGDRRRSPRLKSIFRSDPIIGQTSSRGQRSSRGQIALEISYGYQIWFEEPLTKK